MKQFMYCILDKVACEYGPIFEAKNNNVALRSFQKVIKDQIVSDFDLYIVGSVDHEAGKVELLPLEKVIPTVKDARDE